MRIAIVVDNPFRALPGLVLLAARLCQHGATCYLVPMNLRQVEIWSLAPDFVLLNYLRKTNEGFARQLIEAGLQVGVLDTEGGIVNLDDYEQSLPSDRSVCEKVSVVFAW